MPNDNRSRPWLDDCHPDFPVAPTSSATTQDIQQADRDFRQLIDRQYEVNSRKAVIESMRHDFQLDKQIVSVCLSGRSSERGL